MPQNKASTKVTRKIESLCTAGCTEINSLLEQAKNGEQLLSLSDFNDKEIHVIITELSQIMAIYNDKKQ